MLALPIFLGIVIPYLLFSFVLLLLLLVFLLISSTTVLIADTSDALLPPEVVVFGTVDALVVEFYAGDG